MPAAIGAYAATPPTHQGQCHHRAAVVADSGGVRDGGGGGRRRQEEMSGSDKALQDATHKQSNRTCSRELRMAGLMWCPFWFF